MLIPRRLGLPRYDPSPQCQPRPVPLTADPERGCSPPSGRQAAPGCKGTPSSRQRQPLGGESHDPMTTSAESKVLTGVPGGEGSRGRGKPRDTSAMGAITAEARNQPEPGARKCEPGARLLGEEGRRDPQRKWDLSNHCLLERHRLPGGGLAKLSRGSLSSREHGLFRLCKLGASVASPTCAPHRRAAPASPRVRGSLSPSGYGAYVQKRGGRPKAQAVGKLT